MGRIFVEHRNVHGFAYRCKNCKEKVAFVSEILNKEQYCENSNGILFKWAHNVLPAFLEIKLKIDGEPTDEVLLEL